MFNFRPDLHWLGSLFGRPDEEEVPGFRFKPPEDDVPGFRVQPPHEQVPGFRMNADGSINEAEATTARRYSGPGGNPSDFFEQPSPGANAFTPVADKPPWGGWGMSPYPEDNDNVPPNMARTPICDMANLRCQQFGNRGDWGVPTNPTMSQLDFYPGPTPLDETVLAGDASFIDACRAAVAREAEQFDWCFGNSILTRSNNGCLVWRVDFKTPRTPAIFGRVNRLVCWQPPGSDDVSIAYLIAQPLEKLK